MCIYASKMPKMCRNISVSQLIQLIHVCRRRARYLNLPISEWSPARKLKTKDGRHKADAKMPRAPLGLVSCPRNDLHRASALFLSLVLSVTLRHRLREREREGG